MPNGKLCKDLCEIDRLSLKSRLCLIALCTYEKIITNSQTFWLSRICFFEKSFSELNGKTKSWFLQRN